MKIVAISDTHQLHDRLTVPDGDVLVHCGDFTNKGDLTPLRNFFNWFTRQPHQHKVVIPGNHELGLDVGPMRVQKLSVVREYTEQFTNLIYLENSETTIDGIKFYGSPITPYFFDWAWNVQRGSAIAAHWNKIPDDVQVLITHGPPHGILDLVTDSLGRDPHQGCEDLRERIKHLRDLKVHLFGHLHLEGGQSLVQDGVTFANAAMCDDRYRIERTPVIVEI